MAYTAGQAAKAAGVSTATITRALKKGTISGQKLADGSWRIEPAELHRVFTPLAVQETTPLAVQDPARAVQDPDARALQAELSAIKDALADAREERDRWRLMAERLSLAPPQPTEQRSLWQRIFGK